MVERKNARTIMFAVVMAMTMIMVLAAIMPYLGAIGSSYRRSMGPTTHAVLVDSSVKANVTVLGSSPDTQFISECLDPLALQVDVVTDNDGLHQFSGIVCIDCTGLTNETLMEYIGPLRALMLTGTPLIFINDTMGALTQVIDGQDVSWVGMVSTDRTPIAVRALKHDPQGGWSGSFDLGGRASDRAQLANAISHAYNWSAERIDNVNVSETVTTNARTYQAFSYVYYSGDAFEPYGRFTISNTFIRNILNYSSSSDLWYVHYRMESAPGYGVYGNDRRTASMSVVSTFGEGASLMEHGPGTAYGAGDVGIHLSPFSDDHFGRWSYGVQDVTVRDHSDSSTDMLRTDHTLDLSKAVSRSPYTIEPGAGIMVEKDKGISFHDIYDVEWKTPSFFTWESDLVSTEVNGWVR
jgi:hypothetical protein